MPHPATARLHRTVGGGGGGGVLTVSRLKVVDRLPRRSQPQPDRIKLVVESGHMRGHFGVGNGHMSTRKNVNNKKSSVTYIRYNYIR